MATTKKTTKKKRKKKKSSAEVAKDLWIKGIANSDTDSKTYSIKNNYVVGEIIDHKVFGRGVVKCLIGNEKIEVVFEDQVKTLVQNK